MWLILFKKRAFPSRETNSSRMSGLRFRDGEGAPAIEGADRRDYEDIMALVEKSPFEFEADDRIKRRRRFGEAVDRAPGSGSVGHRADRGAVSIVYDGTSNHRDLDGELRFGVAVRARRRRRDPIGLSPGAERRRRPL